MISILWIIFYDENVFWSTLVFNYYYIKLWFSNLISKSDCLLFPYNCLHILTRKVESKINFELYFYQAYNVASVFACKSQWRYLKKKKKVTCKVAPDILRVAEMME